MNFEEKRLRYRDDFPVLENNNWLNHAGHSPYSRSCVAAMEDFVRSFSEGPMRPYTDWDGVRDKSRALLAELIGAKYEEIGFNFNTSLALQMLAYAIKWEPGDNIIIPDRTFPSIVYPAKILEQHGVEARMIDTIDGLISEDRLLDAIDRRTKMMIVPLVNFLTGQRLDVKRIASACRGAGVFLSVDAIQAAGAIKVDVKELNCHALSFGSPKWMLGPMGVGTVYIDLDEIKRLVIPQMGMCSVVDPWDFFDYDQDLNVECSRYECGCSAHISHHGIIPNVEMFLDLGPENTEKHILELCGYLYDRLIDGGADVVTPIEDERRAGIVTFDAKSAGWDNADALNDALANASVTVSVRMGLIRVSPHFYNTREDVDRFLEVVFG